MSSKVYLGTFRQRPVLRLAPDAFIRLNKEQYLTNAKNEKVYFNNDIQSININGNVDTPPNTASITFIVPRSEESRYFYGGRCILQNMMEIEIFIKGRYHVLDDNGNIQVPPPFQQFQGLIVSVSDDYNGDQHTISIQCKDMLYWMAITKMNARPSALTAQSVAAAVTPFRSTFQRSSPKEIMRSLVDYSFGGQNDEQGDRRFSAAFVPETANSVSFTMGIRSNAYQQASKQDFVKIQEDLIQDYWKSRFKLDADQT